MGVEDSRYNKSLFFAIDKPGEVFGYENGLGKDSARPDDRFLKG